MKIITTVLAQLVSAIFHPLLWITYAMLYLLWIDPYAFGQPSFATAIQHFDVSLIRIFISTALLPFIAVLMMRGLGMIESLRMDDPQDRIGPYIATGIFYLWIFFNINSNPQLPDTLKLFVLGATAGLFFAFFINNFTKISPYTVGAGTWVAFVVMNIPLLPHAALMPVLQVTFLVAGVIGTARLLLQRQRPADVLGGYMVGVLAQMLASFVIGWL